jgi:hypothetical protein
MKKQFLFMVVLALSMSSFVNGHERNSFSIDVGTQSDLAIDLKNIPSHEFTITTVGSSYDAIIVDETIGGLYGQTIYCGIDAPSGVDFSFNKKMFAPYQFY